MRQRSSFVFRSSIDVITKVFVNSRPSRYFSVDDKKKCYSGSESLPRNTVSRVQTNEPQVRNASRSQAR